MSVYVSQVASWRYYAKLYIIDNTSLMSHDHQGSGPPALQLEDHPVSHPTSSNDLKAEDGVVRAEAKGTSRGTALPPAQNNHLDLRLGHTHHFLEAYAKTTPGQGSKTRL